MSVHQVISHSDTAVDRCIEELLSVASETDDVLFELPMYPTITAPAIQDIGAAIRGGEARLQAGGQSAGLDETPNEEQEASTALQHASDAPDRPQPHVADDLPGEAAASGATPPAGQSIQESKEAALAAPAGPSSVPAADAQPVSSTQATAPAGLMHREPHEFLPGFVSEANRQLNAQVLGLERRLAGTKKDAVRTAERGDAMAAHMRLLQVEEWRAGTLHLCQPPSAV